MEGLAINLTRCIVRGLAALGRDTVDGTEWALEEPTADVTECTVKDTVTDETERAMIENVAGMTQCVAMELTVIQQNELCT